MLDKLKALWKAKSIFDAIKQMHGDGFSFQLAAVKMAKLFGWSVLGIVISYYMAPDHLAILLGVLPDTLQKMLTPFVISGLAAAWNWYTKKDNEVMLVVPLGEPNAVPVPISVKPAIPPQTEPTIPKDDAGI